MKLFKQNHDIHPAVRRAQWIGLTVSLLMLGATSYQMYTLNEQHQLWGRLPLLFELSLWFSFVFLRIRSVNFRWLGLSVLSGVLLSAAFLSSWAVLPCLFLGFVPLLQIEREISENNGIAKKLVFRYAFNAFAIWNVGATWWVLNAGLGAGLVANFLNAFFMCVPFLLFHQFSQRFLEGCRDAMLCVSARGIVFAAFWIGFEWTHLNWDLSWSWLTLGNAFARVPSWIQWYEWTGVFGGSLLVIFVNFLMVEGLNFYQKTKKIANQYFVIATILIFGQFIISKFAFSENKILGLKKSETNVVIVQPNYEPHYVKFDKPESAQVREMLALAVQKVDSTTDYLIFPETVIDFVEIKAGDNADGLMTAFRNFVKPFPKLQIAMGIGAWERLQAPDLQGRTAVRTSKRGGYYYEIFNAATLVRARDTTPQYPMPIYKKSKLVPGAEILPFKKQLFFLKPLFENFGGTVEGLGCQAERAVFGESGNQLAPVICYESIFGDFCTDYVRKNANFLAVMTNDGWWDDSPGYEQHFQFARLRAIETRRSVVRAANTGASGWIDAYGNVKAQTKYGEIAVEKYAIPLNNGLTFYAKHGDWIAKGLIFIAIILLAILFFDKIKRQFAK